MPATLRNVALALAAHPDDIEFLMAGTLRLLHAAGWQTHYMTVANGSCGSTTHGPAAIARIRAAEARAGARILGARFHPSLTDDATILYGMPLLRRIASVVRLVRPVVVLAPSPQDYMEDHTETCRLAVTAAFVRGMPNFRTMPARRAIEGDVTVSSTRCRMRLLGPPRAICRTHRSTRHRSTPSSSRRWPPIAASTSSSPTPSTWGPVPVDDGRHVARDGTDVRRVRTRRRVATAPASRALRV